MRVTPSLPNLSPGQNIATGSYWTDERREDAARLALFHNLARGMPLGLHFANAAELEAWCLARVRAWEGRAYMTVVRSLERAPVVARWMWEAIEAFEAREGFVPPTGHGPILLDAWLLAWTRLQRGLA